MKKRGVSPIIATVLLVAIVVVMAAIIFMWFRGMTKEAIVKGDTNAELVCEDVVFEASYSESGGEGKISISNIGNVPIYSFRVKITKDGSYSTKDIEELSDYTWPSIGLNQGGLFSNIISGSKDAEEIILIPVLRGTTKKGEANLVCDEERYGYRVI